MIPITTYQKVSRNIGILILPNTHPHSPPAPGLWVQKNISPIQFNYTSLKGNVHCVRTEKNLTFKFQLNLNFLIVLWYGCFQIGLQERSLRILYRDDESTFEELLVKDNSITVHDHNIKLLATEMFKVKNDIQPNVL